jgi:RNA polymerase sigma factor (sigma-70 family)
VVEKRFSWAYRNSSSKESKRTRRFVEYEDLIQEGSITLLDAWRMHDPSISSFKTYAYASICRNLYRYISANLTPVTTTTWKKASESSEEVLDKHRRAMACRLFSEMVGDPRPESDPLNYGDASQASDVDNILEREWRESCINKLRKNMRDWEFGFLMARARGDTYKQIGEMYSGHQMCHELARRTVGQLMVVASMILLDESEVSYSGEET